MPATITLRETNKSIKSDKHSLEILKPITLSIEEGEFVGICGKSGSGKSTLLNLMTGIDKASSGEVRILGRRVDSMSVTELDRWRGIHIGIVFQFFQLIPNLTALENVLLPMDLCSVIPKSERVVRARELLEKVDLAQSENVFPSILSGGEQQRVAIARALANDPPLIFSDEPTGNLDSINAKRILTLFEQLHQEGKTVLIVSHDEAALAITKRVIRIHDGELIADAPYDTVQPLQKESRENV